jgi:uncharacterized protein YdaU (DUF1376 family)
MSMPYFALYPVDFLADVGHLGNTELGIYWRLLLVYYRDGKPLPCDTDRLRRIAMSFSPEENRCLDAVVSEFFVMTTEPDGTRVWRNRRADREIERAISIYANKVGGAEKARAARAAKAAGGVVGAGAVPAVSHEELPPAPAETTSDVSSDVSPDIKPDAALIPTGESEQESEQEKEKNTAPATPALPKAPAGFQDALVFLVAEGVPQQAALDWLKVRAKKRAPLTKTVWAAILREAATAGMTPAEAVQKSAERGWQGFEASWVLRDGTKPGSSKSIAGMDYTKGIGEDGSIL